MTPKEIEDKAQYWATECFNEENWGNHKHSYITGALSQQPEIDQLKERVKELEEGISLIKTKAKLFYFDSVITQIHNICKQLLTKKQ